jgi:hypothetical protein
MATNSTIKKRYIPKENWKFFKPLFYAAAYGNAQGRLFVTALADNQFPFLSGPNGKTLILKR